MKRYKKNLLAILMTMAVMMLSACGVSSKEPATSTPVATTEAKDTNKEDNTAIQEKQENTAEPKATESSTKIESDLEVQFIDIGQGDSILLKSGNQTMLVDAGNNEYGEGLVTYLNNQGIKKIDYLIGTHPDADHIGGLDIVINKLEIGKVYMPKKQNNTKTFEDVLTAIAKKGLKITSPKVGDSFTVGSATVTILGPEKSYDDNNNNSIVVKVTHGKNSFLLMGDAELQEEEDLVSAGEDLSATVLKVGHHGSHSSTSQSLLKKVNPTYAVISCGAGNTYGHPHKETMTYLNRANVKIYRTDEQQTITMVSDGSKITAKTGGASVKSSKTSSSSGSSSNAAKDETVKNQTSSNGDVSTSTEASYIGNKNSKKFHRPSCSSLPAEKNRVTFSTRKEAVDAGYDACGRCNP